MPNPTLYFFPLSCARIAMVALEHTGIAYDTKIVNLMAHDQKGPRYLAINPAGKVPALKLGDVVLTENVAIIQYLDELYPGAGLLPANEDPIARARSHADLMWIATTLHPLVRQLRAPVYYTTDDIAPVRAKALEQFNQQLAALDAELASKSWWYGENWSAADAYLGWIVSGFTSVGNDLAVYPSLVAYMARLSEHPAYARMLAEEGRLIEQAGIVLPPGVLR